MNVDMVLYIIAFILEVLAGIGVDARGQNLEAWGLAVFMLSFLI